MKNYLPILFLLGPLSTAFAQDTTSTEHFNKPLIKLLDSLTTEDQKWRNYFTQFENHQLGPDTISRQTISRNWIITDSLNYITAENIFKKYGFPNYDLVGKKGSNDFWLLIQHQDEHPKFQDSVLAKMKIEVDAGKASSTNYAYLVDRVKINTWQLQIYGTQMMLNSDSTSYQPQQVIEPDKLNERRKSVGLSTIESYIELMNTHFFGTLKKK